MEDRQEKQNNLHDIQILSVSPHKSETEQLEYIRVTLEVDIKPDQPITIQIGSDNHGDLKVIESAISNPKPGSGSISIALMDLIKRIVGWVYSYARPVQNPLKHLINPVGFFVLSVIIYLITRLIGLTQFPIYFFTDEAIQTVSAADLVRNHFYGPDKILLPTYFQNGNFYNLSLSVYAQVIPYILFAKSIFATRSVSVIISLFAAISLALCFRILGREFGKRKIDLREKMPAEGWWSVILFLSITPAWFLHSHTAFETVLFASFFGIFLAAYLLYRYHLRHYIYLAVISGALAFYSYSPGQVVLAVFTLGLFLSDFRFHWQNRRVIAVAIILGLICLIPYFRFLSYHESAPLEHLRNLASYWMTPIPLSVKIGRYIHEYLYGLNPYYWIIPNDHDLIRHIMKGYGHLGFFNLPFLLIGFIVMIMHLRNSANRVILLAILAAPSGAALVGIGITRVLVMVIPMSVLAAMGWQTVLDWMNHRKHLSENKLNNQISPLSKNLISSTVLNKQVAQISLFMILASVNLYMLWDGLYKAPTWYDDYGLYGMQYGAKQLFGDVIPRYIQADSKNMLFVSSLWANGADVFIRFFIPEEYSDRIIMGSIDTFLSQKQPLDEHMIFILTPEEFRQALASPKMKYLGLLETVPYPNGKDGFYVVRLGYVDNVDQIFAIEKEARRHLIAENLEIQGIHTRVQFSPIDAGQLSDAFDGDVYTLMRGLEANPFVLDLTFGQILTIKGISANFGSMDFEFKVILYNTLYPDGLVIRQVYKGLPPDPHIELLFPQPYQGDHIRIEILSLSEGEEAKIHIREIGFIE